MRQKKFWFTIGGVFAVLALGLMLPTGAGAASTYKTLHEFKGPDGANPYAGLVFDTGGNLYGTTQGGGVHNSGTVFKLKPNADGSWTESVLHNFCSLANCADGFDPTASLTFDAAGNLYGTAQQGGNAACAQGCGVVFKLTPNSNGSWTESVLHTFNVADGAFPTSGLIFDSAGNLYGTTFNGGTFDAGTAFKLAPNADRTWTESVLYNFCNLSTCGYNPDASLVFDGAGNLYGTTHGGGSAVCVCGTVFKLTPNSDGSWTESVLYLFNGTDGAYPAAGLIFDTEGNLYGTTSYGGISSCSSPNGLYTCGTVFELTPNSDGSWAESVIRYFSSAAFPQGSLTFDAAGNLYGTTPSGGFANNGRLFKLAPQSGGGWSYSVLRLFHGKPAADPSGSVVFDKAGNLFGMTQSCGSGYNCFGVVYEIVP